MERDVRALREQVFKPFGGFADSTPIEQSIVRLPTCPGIGLRRNRSFTRLSSVSFTHGPKREYRFRSALG